MIRSKCVQCHHPPLLGRPLLWDAHHPPSALRQTLSECKAVFCLLSTHNLGSSSIQTCEIVPIDEAVDPQDLQDPGSQHNQLPPSREVRVETWHQGVKKGDKDRANIWSILSSVSQLLSTECLLSHWGPSCLIQGNSSHHPSLKVSLPSLTIFYPETYEGFLALMPLPFCKIWLKSTNVFKNKIKFKKWK